MPAAQTSIPGTESKIPEVVQEAFDEARASAEESKAASSRKKLRFDALHMHMTETNTLSVPYLDEKGKRKVYKLSAKIVGKAESAPRGGGGRRDKADPPGAAQDSDELAAKRTAKKADKEAAEVEHKKRSRSSVKAELEQRDADLEARDKAADPIGTAAAEATAASDESWAPASSNPYAEDGDPRSELVSERDAKAAKRAARDKPPKADQIDRETRAAGKCGLVHRDSGSICVSEPGHNGLHTNASGWKWKARMPKEAK